MVRKLVSFALHQPLFLAILTLIFVGASVAAFRSLPIEAFPDITDTQVQIITLFPGHAPEEVEKQVTIPVEIGLSGLPHAIRMFSHTQFGLSFVIVTFDDQANDYFARQQVLERLQTVGLPEGVQPQLAPLSTPIGEIYRYSLQGQGLSPTDLRTIQDWQVSRYLLQTPGVADIVSFGGFIKQYQASIDLAKMKYYGVTLQQVLTALGRGNANAGGSYLDMGEQQYIIRGIGLLRSPADIGNVVVSQHEGTPLLLRDLAEVTESAVPRQGLIGMNENPEVVSGIVLMRKGENPSDVLDALKVRVQVLNTSILPEGVKVVPYYDRAWLIHTTLHTVFHNLTEGAVLVTLILFLFLGQIRPAAIVAVMIPLSLMATFLGLSIKGIPANLLSLGAMDFGIIVDGAVIVVENIYRRLSHLHGEQHPNSLKAVIREATEEVGRPTLFSMLIIITAHLPIFALQRQEGRIFSPMAYTVTSALVGSLLFSMTLVPLLCFFLLRKNLVEKEPRIVLWCQGLYRKALQAILQRRKTVLLAAVGALLMSLLIFPRLGSEFLPELNEGTIWINATLPPGIAMNEVSRVTGEIRKIILRFPEVKLVVSKAGRPEDGTDPKPLNMLEFFVDVKPPEAWRKGMTKEKLIEEMEKALDEIPGIDPSFSQPIRDNVLESISQIDGQIVIKVFGEDAETLQKKAEEVLDAVSKVRGVARAFIDRAGEIPQLQIEINRQNAARYGLNVSDVEDVIETALGGKSATQIWEGEKKFSVVVRLKQEERNDLNAIRNILVDTPSGQRVPLEQVADIRVKNGAMNISRESGTRVKAIGVFIRGRDMGSLVAEMQNRVATDVKLPPGYYVTWGGEFENQKRAMERLMFIVPVSIFLIFVILFNAFKSARDATIILLNVPFALIGGIFLLLFTGIHLSVSAAIGFIALFGQAVLNGVVMVSYFNQLKERGLSAYEAVIEGSNVRLRTVLMTALLAMLGLLPMALSHGIGSEVQKPLAVVIIGGLVSATLLTLFVLPTIYLMFEERANASVKPSPQATPSPT